MARGERRRARRVGYGNHGGDRVRRVGVLYFIASLFYLLLQRKTPHPLQQTSQPHDSQDRLRLTVYHLCMSGDPDCAAACDDPSTPHGHATRRDDRDCATWSTTNHLGHETRRDETRRRERHDIRTRTECCVRALSIGSRRGSSMHRCQVDADPHANGARVLITCPAPRLPP